MIIASAERICFIISGMFYIRSGSLNLGDQILCTSFGIGIQEIWRDNVKIKQSQGINFRCSICSRGDLHALLVHPVISEN